MAAYTSAKPLSLEKNKKLVLLPAFQRAFIWTPLLYDDINQSGINNSRITYADSSRRQRLGEMCGKR